MWILGTEVKNSCLCGNHFTDRASPQLPSYRAFSGTSLVFSLDQSFSMYKVRRLEYFLKIYKIPLFAVKLHHDITYLVYAGMDLKRLHSLVSRMLPSVLSIISHLHRLEFDGFVSTRFTMQKALINRNIIIAPSKSNGFLHLSEQEVSQIYGVKNKRARWVTNGEQCFTGEW